MSPRSTVTLMCFLHGPMSLISTILIELFRLLFLAIFGVCGVRSAGPRSQVRRSVGSRVSSVMASAPRKVKKAERAEENAISATAIFTGLLGRSRAGDGARTHDSHVGNVALYH